MDTLKKFNLFIGERVKNARKKAGLTLKRLAEESHLPQLYLQRIEKGLCSPSHHAIEKIEKATGANFNWENIYEEWKNNHASCCYMTEHTPGPWHVDGFAICDKDGKHIARVYMPEGMTVEEHEANAKLIAATPQIFKTMQNLAQRMSMQVCVDDM